MNREAFQGSSKTNGGRERPWEAKIPDFDFVAVSQESRNYGQANVPLNDRE